MTANVMERAIKTDEDLKRFLESAAFRSVWDFLLLLNESVKDVARSECELDGCSDAVRKTVAMLSTLGRWIDEVPPVQQPARFGNKAFRTWRQRLVANGEQVLRETLLPTDEDGRVAEIAAYLLDSFGNETRIDYGSGHEASFLLFLYCLHKIGLFSDNDARGLVLQVMPAYLMVTRKLQTVYMLEPAGSHGVWGLDDFSFLPFLWGSSQLHSNTQIPARSIEDKGLMEKHKDNFLYCGAIAYINEVKKGPFFEHSPMLCDISAVREGWPKINQGLLKMYRAEVWSKKPVVQHIQFGKLFPFPSQDV